MVRLKSGGPNMTFTKLCRAGDLPDTPEASAICVWFEGDEEKKGQFPLSSLVLAFEADKPEE